ncbi:MAG: hypothetical protein ACJA1N_001219 [Saprospiraceae bacterium]|jgi:hypothetical protein
MQIFSQGIGYYFNNQQLKILASKMLYFVTTSFFLTLLLIYCNTPISFRIIGINGGQTTNGLLFHFIIQTNG